MSQIREPQSREPSWTLIPGASLTPSPWKNGGGVTREIAAHPAGAGLDRFIWRLSLADVARPGPFSRFAGIDRVLVLLSGKGMVLDQGDGTAHTLAQPLDRLAFVGETPIDARLIDGATRDFNLMVRRDAAQGQLDVWQGAGTHRLDGDVAVLHCAHGPLTVRLGDAEPIELEAEDTLCVDAPVNLACRVEGGADSALLAIRIRYQDAARPTT